MKISHETAELIRGMPIVLAGKYEPETQAGFQCVLRKMVQDLCKTAPGNNTICLSTG